MATKQTTTTELHIDWYSDSPETVELSTDDKTIIKGLIQMEVLAADDYEAGQVVTVRIPHHYLSIGPRPEAAPKAPRKPANRPERTFEQKVTKLFQLRKGKAEKARGKALTKKQAAELLAQCEETVRAKAEAAGVEEAPAPAAPAAAPAAPVEETPETPEEETPETPVDWGDQEFTDPDLEDLEPTPADLEQIETGLDEE